MAQTLTVELLFSAYTQGIFPMADELGEIGWYCPNPRAIIPIENYKPSKSLRQTLRKNEFEIRIDSNFKSVMEFCSQPRGEDNGVWISNEMIEVYTKFHKLGFAHSVESYLDNELVGGLYGVAIGGVFFGESMFTRVSNASKVAFHSLIDILRLNEFELLDSQFINDNVKRYGAIEINRETFLESLSKSILKPCKFKFQ